MKQKKKYYGIKLAVMIGVEPSEEEKRQKENYEKAKQDYKKSTGREWYTNDWERELKEAFEDILGKSVNLDDCYEILGLPNNTEFSQVKRGIGNWH